MISVDEKIRYFVINLDRSTNRMEEFKDAFSKIDLKIERISAIDGNLIDTNSFSNDKTCRKEMGRSIQKGEVGCFLSHKKALEKFLTTEAKYAVVFEDDAVPNDEFDDIINEIVEKFLEINQSTAAINLGAVDFKYSSSFLKVKNNMLRCAHRFPMLATGVLWTRFGAKTFLENSSIVTMPYDNFLRFLFSGTNQVFSIQPPVIYSSGIESDIEARNLSERRSTQNKSKFYFFIKQKRIFRDKLKAIRAIIRWVFSKNRSF